jgi:hypothetical protein
MNKEPKRKRTPEEILDTIEESDQADEVDRILGLSDAQLDHELAEAGFDPEQVRARGREIGERLTREADATGTPGAGGPAGEASVTKLPGPRRMSIRLRWGLTLAAALAAGVAAVALTPGATPVAAHRPSSVDADKAAALRDKAATECAAKNWKACLEDLDAAKALDPRGEDDSIRRERLAAEAALQGTP